MACYDLDLHNIIRSSVKGRFY